MQADVGGVGASAAFSHCQRVQGCGVNRHTDCRLGVLRHLEHDVTHALIADVDTGIHAGQIDGKAGGAGIADRSAQAGEGVHFGDRGSLAGHVMKGRGGAIQFPRRLRAHGACQQRRCCDGLEN